MSSLESTICDANGLYEVRRTVPDGIAIGSMTALIGWQM